MVSSLMIMLCIQNAAGSPWFNKPGTTTEGQAFFLMMEAVYRKLKGLCHKDRDKILLPRISHLFRDN